MRRRNYNVLYITIIVLVICLSGIVVAYATLNTSLNINFGNLKQKALTWDVGFAVENVEGVPSSSDVECGPATVTKTTVSGVSIKFQGVGDKCSYTFKVENNGTLGAEITAITPKLPTDTSCTTNESTMICGDITYKLHYDSATSSIQPSVGDVLEEKSGTSKTTRNIVLTAEYTGVQASTTDFSQNNFGFSIVYGQH